MNRKIGLFMMILGAMSLIAAIALFIFNELEDRRAGENAEKYLNVVKQEITIEIQAHAQDTSAPEENLPDSWKEEMGITPAPPKEMKVVNVDGYDYIGYLSVPDFELELPVLSEWDYDLLKISPCRYTGSTGTNNLVIAGHNYKHHFNPLHNITQGAAILFTDMEGRVYTYKVESIETIEPTHIYDMTITPYELTLFTCTYGGQARHAVRCKLESIVEAGKQKK